MPISLGPEWQQLNARQYLMRTRGHMVISDWENNDYNLQGTAWRSRRISFGFAVFSSQNPDGANYCKWILRNPFSSRQRLFDSALFDVTALCLANVPYVKHIASYVVNNNRFRWRTGMAARHASGWSRFRIMQERESWQTNIARDVNETLLHQPLSMPYFVYCFRHNLLLIFRRRFFNYIMQCMTSTVPFNCSATVALDCRDSAQPTKSSFDFMHVQLSRS